MASRVIGRAARRRGGLLLPVCLALVLVCLAGTAGAESLREFAGVIGSADDKRISVSNRQGDSLSFERSAATQVSGNKSTWESLATGDTVLVSWKLGDQPRIAHRVRVK